MGRWSAATAWPFSYLITDKCGWLVAACRSTARAWHGRPRAVFGGRQGNLPRCGGLLRRTTGSCPPPSTRLRGPTCRRPIIPHTNRAPAWGARRVGSGCYAMSAAIRTSPPRYSQAAHVEHSSKNADLFAANTRLPLVNLNPPSGIHRDLTTMVPPPSSRTHPLPA